MKQIIVVKTLPSDSPVTHSLDPESVSWVQELFVELNEEVTKEELSKFENEIELSISVTMKKLKLPVYGESVIITGTVEGIHAAYCIRSGKPMTQKISFPVMAVAIEKYNEKEQELEEETSLFIGEEEHELFYYENSKLDIKELLHELIYLNKEPYPKLDE